MELRQGHQTAPPRTGNSQVLLPLGRRVPQEHRCRYSGRRLAEMDDQGSTGRRVLCSPVDDRRLNTGAYRLHR